jgi:glycerophosphoryl diester phosphodiesterase
VPPGVELHLEIKHGSAVYPGIEERVVDQIHRRSALVRTLVSSFDHAALYSVRSLDAKVRLGYLLGLTTLKTAFREMKEIAAESLNLSLRQVHARAVKASHERGFKVLVYTVNTPADRDRMAAIGADGIFCNYPELDLW